VQREVEDMQALIAATGARFIFGLSSGALVSLRTALFTRRLAASPSMSRRCGSRLGADGLGTALRPGNRRWQGLSGRW
jgi:hypothetical protein